MNQKQFETKAAIIFVTILFEQTVHVNLPALSHLPNYM